MSNELFKNVGTSIKTWARIWAMCIRIGAILCAVGLAITGFIMLDDSAIGFVFLLIAAVVAGLGHVLSRLTVMRLYALGEITERVMSIDTKLGLAKQGEAANLTRVPNAEQRPREKRTGPWKCPYCEHLNSADARLCTFCGREDTFKGGKGMDFVFPV